MKWTSQASACFVAMVLAGCNGSRSERNAGATSGSETGSMSDTSRMSPDTSRSSMTPSDTTSGMTRSDTGMKSDSARRTSRTHSDSSKSKQSKTGVTNTSKGDTINSGVDSAH